MHSSTMRAVRCSSRLLGEGVSCPGGVSAQGVSAPVHAAIHTPL